MGKITVWTKQHENILENIRQVGRHITKKEYIAQKMEDHADLYFDVYHWYVSRAALRCPKPADVSYPTWVFLTPDGITANSEGNVILELSLEASQVITLDIDKWGYIVNYLYLHKDEADKSAHQKKLDTYGIDDSHAYMSNFYPSIKQEIIRSWDRLFDENITYSPVKIGTIWEVREEWITKVIR